MLIWPNALLKSFLAAGQKAMRRADGPMEPAAGEAKVRVTLALAFAAPERGFRNLPQLSVFFFLKKLPVILLMLTRVRGTYTL